MPHGHLAPSEWALPPAMVGGQVCGPVLIARSADLVLAARQVLAYPTGVEIAVEAHRRQAPRPPHGSGHRGPGRDPAGALRFAVRFADDRRTDPDDAAGPGPSERAEPFRP